MSTGQQGPTQDAGQQIVDVAAHVFLAAGTVAWLAVQIRTADLGWTARDTLQTALLCSLAVLVLLRRTISVRTRAALLVLLAAITGASGYFSPGLLGASMLWFMVAVVLASAVFDAMVVLGLKIAILGVFAAGAAGFSTHHLALTTPPEVLLGSVAHWVTWGTSLACVIVILAAAIIAQRRAPQRTGDEARAQRDALATANEQLNAALAEIQTLADLLPICAHCRRVRDDEGYWRQLEEHVRAHTSTRFSHGICPCCLEEQMALLDAEDPNEEEP